MQVIRAGGKPHGIHTDSILPKADSSLVPYLQGIEKIWKPYREAAKTILFYLTFEMDESGPAKAQEIHQSLYFIEENAETLLTLNNDLMLACLRLNEFTSNQLPVTSDR